MAAAGRGGRTYVAISRESGTDAAEIAGLLGQKLRWEVLDKTLVDRVAEPPDPRSMLDVVDETESNWIYDVLGTWMDDQIVTHNKYVAHLTARCWAAGAPRKVVRKWAAGHNFILRPEKGLTVRIVASEKYRVDRLMRRYALDEAKARRFYILETDRGRREFVGRYFHHDVTDPHLYDLVLNVERLGAAATVDQIIAALCR